MEGYKHLEPPWLTLSDGDFQRAPQTLFVQPAPVFSVRFELSICGALLGFYEPPHSSFQRVVDTSFWRRSHARTFYCRILGS